MSESIIFRLFINLLVTFAVYSGPIIVYRELKGEPIRRVKAVLITIIYGIIAFFLMSLLTFVTSGNVAGSAIILWCFINYKVLTHGLSDSDGSSDGEQSSSDEDHSF